MKISSTLNYNPFPRTKTSTNTVSSQNKAKAQKVHKDNISFKSIYLKDGVSYFDLVADEVVHEFSARDNLCLQDIANRYPYQDCFIEPGFQSMPALKYREKPPELPRYSENLAGQYVNYIDPEDPDNPAVTLLLDKEKPYALYYGVPSYVSLNPSLELTVQAGYELHKKLLEKKYEILDAVGKSSDIDFGEKTVTEMAHEAIADVETAVTRYLIESAYAALKDRASAAQIYASNYLLVQTRLKDKRRLELTRGYSELEEIRRKSLNGRSDEKVPDICEIAMKKYPNTAENLKRIDALSEEMMRDKIFLAGSAL